MQSIIDADNRNYGSRPRAITKLFFSPDKNAEANFRLRGKVHFNAAITACYYGHVLFICGMSMWSTPAFSMFISITVMFCFLDTYREAKIYVDKNRAITPINYSEDDRERHVAVQRQLNEQQQEMANAYERIRIKSERITNLKKALNILNIQHDKRKIEDIDLSDVDEFDVLLSDEETPDEPNMVSRQNPINCGSVSIATMPIQPKVFASEAGPSYLAITPNRALIRTLDVNENDSHQNENTADGAQDDDLIVIDSRCFDTITTVTELYQVDGPFSLEYSFTTNVS